MRWQGIAAGATILRADGCQASLTNRRLVCAKMVATLKPAGNRGDSQPGTGEDDDDVRAQNGIRPLVSCNTGTLLKNLGANYLAGSSRETLPWLFSNVIFGNLYSPRPNSTGLQECHRALARNSHHAALS